MVMSFFRTSNTQNTKKTNPTNGTDVSRWDLFTCVAGRPEGIALARIAHTLHVERERSLILPLGELEDEDLIVCDSKDHYILSTKPRAQELRVTMAYALAYGYDYNVYFDEEMVAFLKKAYRSDYFNLKDVSAKLMPPAIVDRLVRDNLLLIYKFDPFIGRIVENPFLDGLCNYLNIKRSGSFSFFREKISLSSVLQDRFTNVEKEDDPQILAAKKFFANYRPQEKKLLPNPIEVELRDSVQKEDSEFFDPKSRENFEKAWEAMHEDIANEVPLSPEVIIKYHKLIMADTDIPSTYRDHEVIIANNKYFTTAAIPDIPYLLEDLLNYLNDVEPPTQEDALKVCAYTYNEFIHIHPFSDGNSRTDRVLLGYLLNKFGLPFERISNSFEVSFLIVSKGAKERNDDNIRDVLEQIYLSCINKLELAKAINQD